MFGLETSLFVAFFSYIWIFAPKSGDITSLTLYQKGYEDGNLAGTKISGDENRNSNFRAVGTVVSAENGEMIFDIARQPSSIQDFSGEHALVLDANVKFFDILVKTQAQYEKETQAYYQAMIFDKKFRTAPNAFDILSRDLLPVVGDTVLIVFRKEGGENRMLEGTTIPQAYVSNGDFLQQSFQIMKESDR